MREGSYTSIRLGLYKPIKVALVGKQWTWRPRSSRARACVKGADKKDSPVAMKFLAGAVAGALGSFVGNPFDLLKTKMMTNTTEMPRITRLFMGTPTSARDAQLTSAMRLQM
jgi:hypothetical protein